MGRCLVDGRESAARFSDRCPLLITKACLCTHFDEIWQKLSALKLIFTNFSQTYPCLRKIVEFTLSRRSLMYASYDISKATKHKKWKVWKRSCQVFTKGCSHRGKGCAYQRYQLIIPVSLQILGRKITAGVTENIEQSIFVIRFCGVRILFYKVNFAILVNTHDALSLLFTVLEKYHYRCCCYY